MKFAIVLFVSACVVFQHVWAEFTAEKYREMHNICIEKSGCTEEIIADARLGKFTPDMSFKMFLKCCFEQEDALDATGNILVDKLLASFHDDLVEKYGSAVHECNAEVSHAGDTHDYIYNFVFCAYEKTQEKFDIP